MAFDVSAPTLEAGNINGLSVTDIQASFVELGDNPAALINNLLDDALHDICLSQLTTSRQINANASDSNFIIADILNFHITNVPSPGPVTIVFVAAGMLAARRKERAPSTATPAAAL